MAVVLDPYKSARSGSSGGPGILEMIQGFMESGKNKSDFDLIAKSTPDQLRDIFPQLQGKMGKEIALKRIFEMDQQKQPVPIYDATGKQTGTAPSNAHFLPAAASAVKDIKTFVSPDGKQTMEVGIAPTGEPTKEIPKGWLPSTVFEAQANRDATAANREATLAQGKQVHADNVALGRDRLEETKKKDQEATSGQFGNWVPEEQEQAYRSKLMQGKDPRFGFGDKASYTQFGKGYAQWKEKQGIDASDEVVIQGKVKADQKALANNENRLAATEQFSNTIQGNAAQIRQMKAQYGQDFGKLMNSAINATKQGTMGSGDVGALQFAMRSLANESAKVESGSLGIAEVSVEQARAMNQILTYNYNEKDLNKILDTVQTFGNIRKKAIEDESTTIEERLRDPGNYKKLTGKKKGSLGPQHMKPGETLDTPQGSFVKGEDGLWHPAQPAQQ
jgi:hypothetical protein